MSEVRMEKLQEARGVFATAELLFEHLSGIFAVFGDDEKSAFCDKAREFFLKQGEKVSARMVAELSRERRKALEKQNFRVDTRRRCHGVAFVANKIGCHPNHLSYILHGQRKPNEKLRSRLARMGITTTVDGEKL